MKAYQKTLVLWIVLGAIATAARRDGSVRDSVMYSILVEEWPDVRRHLELRLMRNAATRQLKQGREAEY